MKTFLIFNVSGELSTFLEKVFFQVNIQQCNDGSSKIVGKFCIFVWLNTYRYFFTDFSIISSEGERLNLQGLGPLNWLAKILIADDLKRKMNIVLKKAAQEVLATVVGKVSVVDYLYIHVLN